MNVKLKILHLEDVLTDAELVGIEIKKSYLSFEKLDVDNRIDYINALNEYVPDIILSDHSLPSFNSLEALKILKESFLNIPFILITSTISEEFAVEIMKEGATDYILKDRMQRLPNAIVNALEKFKLEAEHQRASQELSLLFNTIDEVFFSRDVINSKLIQVSPACEKVFGYTGSEMLNTPNLEHEILYPADQHIHEENYKKLLLGQTALSRYRIIHKEGSIRWVESKIMPRLSETGVLIRLSGVTRDITEQKLAEESLVRSEGNLRSVFENTDLSIILFTNDLKVAAFNSNANGFAWRNFKKYIKVSDSGFDFFPEQRKDFIKQVMERIDQKEEEISYETSYIRDGITEWYDVKWIGIFNPQMENIGIVFTVKNITEKKNDDFEREKMTADLVRRNNDLEQFTYIISHNLRAPVANIMGLSDLMQKFDTGQEEDTKALKALSVSAKRLDEVILDLNHILQLNNEVNEKIETIDLPNIIENIKTSITNLIEKENVSFNLNFDEVSSITTLKNYLHSIFYNLIINSIKYRQSHLPPVIEISTVKDDNKIIVKYKDNGKGIDLEKNRKDLFGLYKRFDYSVEGKGMGLFMVKTQIENLGGKISVESQLDKGTEFKLEFPIQQ